MFGSKRFLCVLVLSGAVAPAQVFGNAYGLNEAFTERIDRASRVVGARADELFGEKISLYNGSVRFESVDVSLPGNGPVVELRRFFDVRDSRFDDGGNGDLDGMADWQLAIPNLSGVFSAAHGWQVAGASPNQRCSSTAQPIGPGAFQPSEFWDGYELYVPERVGETLLVNSTGGPSPSNGLQYPWKTKSGWMIRCKTGTNNGYPGQGFIATAPDGTSYHLDHVVRRPYPSLVRYRVKLPIDGSWVNNSMPREKIYFLASRVEDRFGNSVSYTYVGDRLSAIGSNDGRQISIGYQGTRIVSVTSHGTSHQYSYVAGTLTTPPRLSSVLRPDGTRWSYTSSGELKIEHDDGGVVRQMPTCFADALGGSPFVYEIVAPSGAKAVYEFAPRRHRRQNMPEICAGWWTGTHPNDPYGGYITFWRIPPYSDSYSLNKKTLTGMGVPEASWNYSYLNIALPRGFRAQCQQNPSSCPLTKQVFVTGPGGAAKRYTFGIWWEVNDGQLLAEESGSSGATLDRQEFAYTSQAEAAASPFADMAGGLLHAYTDPLVAARRPLKESVEVRQERAFRWKVAGDCGGSGLELCYDHFGRPTRVVKSSSASP